jgi:protein-S-isoprenylcysteine O-methyltransferase Ste14
MGLWPALGTWLFRHRSLTPLPVLLFVAWRLFAQNPPPGAPVGFLELGVTASWLLMASGEALRFWAVGLAAPGTSGRSARMDAATLTTEGPYGWVRNPLYLGNFCICLGLTLLAHDAWTAVAALGFFALQYWAIVRAEEAFLAERFGDAYGAYCARVPRWVPRPPAERLGVRRAFELPKALMRESNPIVLWTLTGLILRGKDQHRGGSAPSPSLYVAAAAVLAGWLVVRALRSRWRPSHGAA